MDLERLRSKLIDAGRKVPPSSEMPYRFEKRIMARLSQAPMEDLFSMWGAALWKGAAACALITALSVVLSVWTFHSAPDSDGDALEMVVLAGADQMTETW